MSDNLAEGFEIVRFPGNHEQVMLRFLLATDNLNETLFSSFSNGGRVANELGLSEREALADPKHFQREAIDGDFIERLKNLPVCWRQDRYLLVQAGIHPAEGLKLLQRDWKIGPAHWIDEDQDPLWIRGIFLTFEGLHQDDVVVPAIWCSFFG